MANMRNLSGTIARKYVKDVDKQEES